MIWGNQFPKDPKAIETLPGVGRYTAGAVASFAFDLPVPAVDANIARVIARLFDFQERIDSSSGQKKSGHGLLIWFLVLEDEYGILL